MEAPPPKGGGLGGASEAGSIHLHSFPLGPPHLEGDTSQTVARQVVSNQHLHLSIQERNTSRSGFLQLIQEQTMELRSVFTQEDFYEDQD